MQRTDAKVPTSNIGPAVKIGLVILFLGIVLFLTTHVEATGSPIFWIAGLAFGITVQRSRFCFTSAFRDLFLLGQTRMLRGVLAGLSVCIVGFAMVMSTIVPNPGFGLAPNDAHILPVGLSTLVAGVLFGIGMVVAGGCVSGSLYRMGEGYVGSWIAIIGVMIGLFFLNSTWNWWWDNVISYEPLIWLPSEISYTWALVATCVALTFILYLGVMWERRKAPGFVMPEIKRRRDQFSTNAGGEMFGYLRSVFKKEWSPIAGGVILGLINLLLFIRFRPLGVVGEISRWSTSLTSSIGFPQLELRGMEDLGGCALTIVEGSWFTEGLWLNMGIIAGSMASAVISGEFKVRIPRSPIRYIQSLVGGCVMGYGAGLGLGCTLGAFFSAVPSLALSGWVYGAGLGLGAFIGVQLIKRIS